MTEPQHVDSATERPPHVESPPDAGSAYLPRDDGTVVGVGVDVVDIARLTAAIERSPALLERLLTPSERRLSAASRAARVAAKEAVGKALGHPGDFSWHDVTVRRTEAGRPYLVLSGATDASARALGVAHLHLSLSHDGGVATAIVVAERGPGGAAGVDVDGAGVDGAGVDGADIAGAGVAGAEADAAAAGPGSAS